MRWRRGFAFSSLRPTSTVSAPAAARPSPIAPQSSPVPPMTTATLPEREKRAEADSGDFMGRASEKEKAGRGKRKSLLSSPFSPLPTMPRLLLEDNYTDVIGKAQRGLQITDEQLAGLAEVSRADLATTK